MQIVVARETEDKQKNFEIDRGAFNCLLLVDEGMDLQVLQCGLLPAQLTPEACGKLDLLRLDRMGNEESKR